MIGEEAKAAREDRERWGFPDEQHRLSRRAEHGLVQPGNAADAAAPVISFRWACKRQWRSHRHD